MSTAAPLKYLAGYPPELLAQVRDLITKGRLAESLDRRYPESHDVCSDGALYDYVAELKSRHMRNAGPQTPQRPPQRSPSRRPSAPSLLADVCRLRVAGLRRLVTPWARQRLGALSAHARGD